MNVAPTVSLPEPDQELAALAVLFGMRPMAAGELASVEPDFALAGFAECGSCGAFLGRLRATDSGESGADALVLVTHAQARLDAQQWLEVTLERLAPAHLIRVLVTPSDFQDRLRAAEQGLRALDGIIAHAANDEPQRGVNSLHLSLAGIETTGSPVVRLVDSTLFDALRLGASDIHFEVQNRSLHVKYRLDGVLQSFKKIDSLETAHQVVSRIKVLADLDISERRVPQDGRFRVQLDERQIDFRVSIMPNLAGEDAVLRILDRKQLTGQAKALTLDSLRFEEDVKSFIRRSAHLPYGLLLVTGPTGSGKTTTLYAAISEINSGLDKIVTIEDPIEYQLNGILQIPVNEKKGLTFATGLRSILRHDPDKIMVGEIRDSETAQIAVQAALTGHQVFTTVHANNVFDVIGRFSNMGVDSYSLVAALTGIVAQRLLRTVCTSCAEDVVVDQKRMKKAVGCPHCRGTGYKGRMAIAETLPIDDEMKDLLIQRAPISQLKQAARQKGFRSLRDAAVSLAGQGLTTMDEVNRITPLS